MDILSTVVFVIFVTIFCIGVGVNLAGPEGIRESYKRWNLPAWFRFITAALEAISVILVFTPLKLLGYTLALLVMFSAIIILVRNREYKPLIAPLLTSAMIIFLLL